MSSPAERANTCGAVTPVAAVDAVLDRAVRRRDYLRGPDRFVQHAIARKEWFHFCVMAPSSELLVNFSLCGASSPERRRSDEQARLTVLARDRRYLGDVDVFESSEVQAFPGRIDLAFGGNRLSYRDGAYRLSFALRDVPVSGTLALRPRTIATVAPNIPLPDGPPLQWAIVPRLVAEGEIVLDGVAHRIDDAPAYHDHNWGHFLWGHRFSWIWGFCLPDDPAVPWSVVFVRLSNRHRSCALAQGLFLWRGAESFRIFREHDLKLEVGLELLRPRPVVKVPGVMGLVFPDTATEVPRRVEMRACADGDTFRLCFELEDLAQVVIPSETDLGVTVINEVTGIAQVEGVVRGDSFAFQARGMCEFLGH